MTRVIGVDACKKGWIGVTSDIKGYFAQTMAEIVALAEVDGPLDVVAIDIPIGLPSAGKRLADVLATATVGARRSSVFWTPTRAALTARSYEEACEINRQRTGLAISQQAWALKARILEVETWARTCGRRVVEVHPEVCFATMAGRPLSHPKSTWAGAEERRRLLASEGLLVPGDLGRAGEIAAVDDVLDAVAAAWSALRVQAGRAISLPDVPEVFDDGLTGAIWA